MIKKLKFLLAANQELSKEGRGEIYWSLFGFLQHNCWGWNDMTQITKSWRFLWRFCSLIESLAVLYRLLNNVSSNGIDLYSQLKMTTLASINFERVYTERPKTTVWIKCQPKDCQNGPFSESMSLPNYYWFVEYKIMQNKN